MEDGRERVILAKVYTVTLLNCKKAGKGVEPSRDIEVNGRPSHWVLEQALPNWKGPTAGIKAKVSENGVKVVSPLML